VHGKDLVLLKRSQHFVFLTKEGDSFSEPAMLPHTGMMNLFLFICMHLQFPTLTVQVLSYSKLEYLPHLLALKMPPGVILTPDVSDFVLPDLR
jgi:hypothetical protein